MSDPTASDHHARVIAYSASSEDTKLTVAIECGECGSQWGWRVDSKRANEDLEREVREHNGTVQSTAYASQSTPWWAEDRHHLFAGGDECERCGVTIAEMRPTGCPGRMEPTA